MKVLIAIIGWVDGCRKGVHNPQRSTFLKDIEKFPGLDYKIFVGDGTPVGEGHDYDSNKSFEAANDPTRIKNSVNQPKPFDYVPEPDEVILQIPDDLAHVAFKARAAWHWALDKGYDYVFNCFCDTYIDIEKLRDSGFEEHDFIGMTYDANRCPQGGAGYWLSRRCLEVLVTSHVDYWADDGWAGWTLPKHGIHLHHDPRYGQYPDAVPNPHNDIISTHLGPHPYTVEGGNWHYSPYKAGGMMGDIHSGVLNSPSSKDISMTLYQEKQ